MSGEHGASSKLEEAQGSRQGTRVRGQVRVPEKRNEWGQSSASLPLAICSALCARSVGVMASQAPGCPWIPWPPAASLLGPHLLTDVGGGHSPLWWESSSEQGAPELGP